MTTQPTLGEHMTRAFFITIASLSLTITSGTANAATRSFRTSGPGVSPIMGDLNNDCLVNVDDLNTLLRAVGSTSQAADLNDDGRVDRRDVNMLDAVFGSTCSDRLTGDVNGDGVVSVRDFIKALPLIGSSNPTADLDNDGEVTGNDLAIIEGNLGATVGARVLGDATGDGLVNIRDILAALAQQGRNGPADCDGDGSVTADDLKIIQARMGANTTTSLPGDINGDRRVDEIDQALLEANFGGDWARADADNDGTVTVSDLIDLLGNISSTSAQVLNGDVNGDGVVNDADQLMLTAYFGTDDAVADINGDGIANTADLLSLLGGFGLIYADNLAGDVDGDCVVDTTDTKLIRATLGSEWTQGDINGDGTVTTDDLGLVISNQGNTCE